MPKKTVKKTGAKKKAAQSEQPLEENKKITSEDLQKIIQTRYAINSHAARWLWVIAFVILAAVLVIWTLDFKMQLSQLGGQKAPENKITEQAKADWNKSFQNLKNESYKEQVNAMIQQIAQSIASSSIATTTTSTVPTSTTSTINISSSTTSTNE